MQEDRRDARLYAAATDRNRGPILDVLSRVLPKHGFVLEIASGTGQHAAYFAGEFPELVFQPSDCDPLHLTSIDAWRREAGCKNLLPPVELDVRRAPWPVLEADAVLNINMIHISPWSVTMALMSGVRSVLPPSGLFYMYGPFRREGQHTAESNAAFDASLRARDPEWGVRDLGEVIRVADEAGLAFIETVVMPANNLSVIFRRKES